jgi:hypothetical protein
VDGAGGKASFTRVALTSESGSEGVEELLFSCSFRHGAFASVKPEERRPAAAGAGAASVFRQGALATELFASEGFRL